MERKGRVGMKNGFTAIIASTLLLSGCSFGSGGSENTTEQQTLKVMYYDEQSFFQQYGMLFTALHPEVDIQVVSTQSIYNRSGSEDEEIDYEEAMQQFIDEEQPDLLMLDISRYEKMAQDGKLYDLGTYIAKDKYDTAGLVPGLEDYMKELGGGQLYGLPIGLNSQVIFYNRDLFDKYNIAYPTDKMTWSEIIQLAKQFPTDGEAEDRVYGLKMGYRSGLNQVGSMLANSEGLSYVNAKTKTMTIDTPAWNNIYETALDIINSDAIYDESRQNEGGMVTSNSYEDYLLRDPFMSGRVAMTIDGSYLMQQMKEAKSYIKEEGKLIGNWDVVTTPVSAQNPDQSANVYYNQIYAIAKESPNADAAWKFISYMSSDEYARVMSKMGYNNGFPIRTKYIKDEENHNLAAFYQLKPTRQTMTNEDYQKLPQQFSMMFYQTMESELSKVESGDESVADALSVLQVKGEELLAQESMSDEELNQMMMENASEEKRKVMEAAGEIVPEDSADADTAEASEAPAEEVEASAE
ncbi:extracellular solute-binding protein [Paenibacillus sp. HB172176]|uniref:ABC transporter substrate-binding protein n=1 Tax=Paenibacillus sp. HB172176 TaxID=2493690 RepID=UPI00143A4CF2|nr:extracellular solute-binding protein [Paenibacillus sp. HB172176]